MSLSRRSKVSSALNKHSTRAATRANQEGRTPCGVRPSSGRGTNSAFLYLDDPRRRRSLEAPKNSKRTFKVRHTAPREGSSRGGTTLLVLAWAPEYDYN